MVDVSQSKIKIWNRCKYAYSMRYNEKLRKKRKSRPLTFGTIIHELLEAHANKEDPFKVLDKIDQEQGHMFAEEIAEYGDIVEDAGLIFEEYLAFDKGSGLQYISYKKKKAEHEINVEVAEGVNFVAKIDALARTPNKLKWLLENKTFSRMPNDDHRWRDLQSAVYLRLLDMLGYPKLDGLCWNYIYSKAPGSIKVNKDGTVSRRETVTLPTKVLEDCKKLKIDPKTIPDILEKAEGMRERYFPRIFVPIKKKAVDIIFKDAIRSSIEIRDDPKKYYPRNITLNCDWCDYEPICRAELQGHDVDSIKEREYVSSKKKDEDKNKDNNSKKSTKRKTTKNTKGK